MPVKSLRVEFLSLLLLVVFVVGFCQDLVFWGEVPSYRDLTNYFYPLRYSLYESYRAGELPLWDRHFAQGFPNLAGFQSAAFYPPHLVFLVLSFLQSIRALFIFHFLIAAIGTYCLMRNWNYTRDLAIVGALLFTIGGVIVSLTNLLNHFQSAVWLPWLIVVWERLLITPRWNSFLCFIFVAALQLLAGSPELYAMSMSLAVLHAFWIRDSRSEVSYGRIVGLVVAGNVVLLAVIMAQALPTLELLIQSRRGLSIPQSEALMWSFQPSSLLNLFFLDKEIEPEISAGMRFYFTRKAPFLLSSYLGIAVLFGIALWFYYGGRREKLILTGLSLGTLALALGSNALIYPFLLKHFPVLTAVRFPEKLFFLTNALLLFMAMRGLQAISLDRNKTSMGPQIVMGVICLLWASAYIIAVAKSELVSNFIALASDIPPLSEAHSQATATVLANLQRQLLLSLALAFLLILTRTQNLKPRFFSILFVLVVFVDLTWAHRSLLFSLHPNKVNGNPSVLQSSEGGSTRLFFYPSPQDLHPAFFTVWGRPSYGDAVALSYQNYLPNVGVLSGIEYFQEIDALLRRPYSEFLTVANSMKFENQIKLLRTFNVGHIVSFRELPERGVRLIRRFPEYFSWLYKVDNTIPRVVIVPKYSVEKDPANILQRLASPDFDPDKEVILSEPVKLRPLAILKAQAKITSYGNSRVTIQATTNESGILVLADSHYPGWKVYVDGNETTLLRANHFYRAVEVSKGDHRVEFIYDPLSFRVGMIVSSTTLVILGFVSVILFLRQCPSCVWISRS
ncbi:MAG: YfhO family protein [Candidatus Binatia bacterium]